MCFKTWISVANKWWLKTIEGPVSPYPLLRGVLTTVFLGIGSSIITAIIVTLNADEPGSVFRAIATLHCHAPPNVGSFVKEAIERGIIVAPGEASDGQAGAPAQAAALNASLCANDRIEGTLESILAAMAGKYPQCFEFRNAPTRQKSFRVILKNQNVCLAHFVRRDGDWVVGKGADNPILCFPEARVGVQSDSATQLPRLCSNEELSRAGWTD